MDFSTPESVERNVVASGAGSWYEPDAGTRYEPCRGNKSLAAGFQSARPRGCSNATTAGDPVLLRAMGIGPSAYALKRMAWDS